MADIYGLQAVRAALRDDGVHGRCLYVARGRRDARANELIGMARAAGIRYQAVEPAWFKRRAADAVHQGVLLECNEVELGAEHELWPIVEASPAPLLLVLDSIKDPRNLGACARTANAAGVDALILPKRNSAPLSAVTLKAAQGGLEGLAVIGVTNLARTLDGLRSRGVWITGADGEASNLYTNVDYRGATAIVCGSEDKGMRQRTRDLCDHLVGIPMLGKVESLNVAVAAGVLLFEALRQRR